MVAAKGGGIVIHGLVIMGNLMCDASAKGQILGCLGHSLAHPLSLEAPPMAGPIWRAPYDGLSRPLGADFSSEAI